jgi:hypothetical protein
MIDPRLIEQYQRDGAVCMRQLFDRDKIATLPAGAPMNHPLFPVLWCLQP